MPMKADYRWDIVVRSFHWSLVILFFLNALVVDEESALHVWIGYAVAGLLALRIVWGLAGPRRARFASFRPSLGAARAHLGEILRGEPGDYPSHNPLGALMVYNLLFTLIAIAATGYLMTTNAFWGVDWVEEVHEALVNWALVSVALHVGGVVFESLRTRESLVAAMITGYRRPLRGGK